MPDFNINNVSSVNPVNSQGIVIPSAPVNDLIRYYNMSNIQVPVVAQNPYDGKVPASAVADKQLYRSQINTPVVADITFDSVEYADYVTGFHKFTDRFTQYTVLITVSQAKKIVKTEIQGLDGTVKEYIGLGDYSVTINGIIVGDNRVYPRADVLTLKKMLDAPVAIPVYCAYLNDLGINNLVIDEYTLPQDAGSYSKQAYTINASSDYAIDLQLK
jgi:Domain of unknown function (DUF6046)